MFVLSLKKFFKKEMQRYDIFGKVLMVKEEG
jgi:hypothetical protein